MRLDACLLSCCFTLQAENTMVLLARDTPANAPAIRDLGLDLLLWQPIIEDRAFVPWLVAAPTEADMAGAQLVAFSFILFPFCFGPVVPEFVP